MTTVEDLLERLGEAVNGITVRQDEREDEVILLNPIKESKIPDVQVARLALQVCHCDGGGVVLVQCCGRQYILAKLGQEAL